MKRVVLWLLVAGALLGVRAQTPDAEFLHIYTLIQEGEAFERSGDLGRAVERFQQARVDLDAFAKAHPSWNRKIVHFRLGYLGEKVGALKARLPSDDATSVASPTLSRPPDTVRVTDAVAPPGAHTAVSTGDIPTELAKARARVAEAEARASAAEARADAAFRIADEATARANEMSDRSARMALELAQARDRIEVLEATKFNLEQIRDRLERGNLTLEAKLAEALRPRAAALDPAELARAEERNRLLLKENAILTASLEFQMAEGKRLLEKAAKALEFEEQLRVARTELVSARREAAGLRVERDKLQNRLEVVARKKDEEIADLKKEIRSLHEDIASVRSPSGSREVRDLASLRKELAEERSLTRELRRENAALLEELNQRGSIRVTPASFAVPEVPADASGDENWPEERARLQAELAAARAELRERDPAQYEARLQELTDKITELEAKLGVLEAKPEPYTPDELALFRAPARRETFVSMQLAQATPADSVPSRTPPGPSGGTQRQQAPQTPPPAAAPTTNSTSSPVVAGSSNNVPANGSAAASQPRRRTVNDLPPGAGQLARQAERAFAQRRFDEAEKVYREILRMDESNVFTLGNLAAILVEQGRFEEGEQMANRALAIDANDPFSLSLIGIVRFRQKRYDEAFSALSRSAEIDPDNADTQNYLGITLSQRGQRKAAEAALRKALKLNPSSASAHYNLAVVYATQKPPFLELARYHYQKALRAGQPANHAFEEVLNGAAEASGPE